MSQPVLFHSELGVGPRGLDCERMVEYPTLARKAVQRRLEREMMAEELRLLYVAMTRAREKLILTMTLADGTRNLERLREDLAVPAAPVALEKQASVGAWILLHALTRPECRGLRALADLPETVNQEVGPAWDIRLIEASELQERPSVVGRFVNADHPEEAVQIGSLEHLSWQYPDRAAALIPSKLTATQIKGRAVDLETCEQAESQEKPRGQISIRRPNFIREEQGLTPSERGTALHLAMQYLPLQGCDTPERVAEEIARLVAGGYLTKLQGQAVEPQKLSAFFASDLGKAMAAAKQCRREFKFSVLVPAQAYYPGVGQEEEVLLQGVIDAWFSNGEGITLVDFKSDQVTAASQVQRAREYLPQLQAYSRALEEMTGEKVSRRFLWFFSTNSAVEL